MRPSTQLLFIIVGLVVCAVIVLYPPSLQGGQKTYEVKPQITIPEYRTDTARAIDAYEQLMQRYMDLTERNLFEIGAEIRVVVRKLDSIDSRLNEISARIANIEKAMGIERPKPSVEKKSQRKAHDIKVHEKSSNRGP